MCGCVVVHTSGTLLPLILRTAGASTHGMLKTSTHTHREQKLQRPHFPKLSSGSAKAVASPVHLQLLLLRACRRGCQMSLMGTLQPMGTHNSMRPLPATAAHDKASFFSRQSLQDVIKNTDSFEIVQGHAQQWTLGERLCSHGP